MIHRKADHPIHPLILNRWSPRAMTGEEISDTELKSLLEAARWAPSCYNEQPWRILYARKSSPHFASFFDLLVPFNQSWTHKAALLGLVISRKSFEKNNKPSPTHAYDAGACWENLSLQGSSLGLVVHGMGGFDYEKARRDLKIPQEFEILAMFAVGKPAPKETLSFELQAKETPSSRKPIESFAFEGFFQQ
jgi:nitroreductase